MLTNLKSAVEAGNERLSKSGQAMSNEERLEVAKAILEEVAPYLDASGVHVGLPRTGSELSVLLSSLIDKL